MAEASLPDKPILGVGDIYLLSNFSGVVKCSPETKLAQNLAVVEGKVLKKHRKSAKLP